MYKKDINQPPGYFDRYISLVPEAHIVDALIEYAASYLKKEQQNLEQIGDKVYAEGKWTIKQILQHIIDTERVFQYRALCFSRGDETILPSFDENLFADEANVDHRTIEDLLEEFDYLRKSVIMMYNSFSEDEMKRLGTASTNTVSVLGTGYTIVGHVIHHMNVIKERYYPLLVNV
jgi:uncharacterized damage-inducible protein DinB